MTSWIYIFLIQCGISSESYPKLLGEQLLLRSPIDPTCARVITAEAAVAKAPADARKPVASGAPTGLLTRAGDGGFEVLIGESLRRAR